MAERTETLAPRPGRQARGNEGAVLGTRVLSIPVLLPAHADCSECAGRLRDLLLTQRGIKVVHFDLGQGALVVHYDPQVVSSVQVERMAEQAGGEVARRYRHTALPVEGLDCADCALKLEQGVGRLDGVFWTSVNFPAGTMRVEYDPEQVDLEDVARRVQQLGYRVAEEAQPDGEARPLKGGLRWVRQHRREATTLTAGILILLGFLGQLGGLPTWWQPIFYGTAIVVAGYSLAVSGLRTLWLARSLDINLLMTVAAVGAMVIGEWAEGAIVVFLFNVGELLESYTTGRARNAIRSLMSLAPDEATRLGEGGKEERVRVAQLQVGDLIVVRPGERIPMDGLVTEGHSAVDQSPVTGESMPVERGPDSQVYAGSVNGEGVLVVRVTRLAQDNTISRMVHMVEEAQAQKARSQRFVDRFARYYTPAVVLAAVVVAVGPPLAGYGSFEEWVYRALVLLVIACPCALVIATPVAVAAAIASAGRHGVLIKGGIHLEDAARLRAIAFDKTGTLTYGKPGVSRVLAVNGYTVEQVLSLAAAVESRSEHPIAQAVVAEAAAREVPLLPVRDVRAVAGRGVVGEVDGRHVTVGSHPYFCQAVPHGLEICRAAEQMEREGNTAILVAQDEEIIGLVGVTDKLRPESKEAVAQLGRLGVRPRLMLTGDNAVVAEAVAQEVGLDDFRANLLPEDKLEAVAQLVEEYGAVGMVGDGVNDAPAMARATLGIAMGAAGTDQALETADVALMGDDLALVPQLVRLSRWAMGIVRQNLAAALLVLNAMRLLRWKPK